MGFLKNIFKRKPGGTLVGNLLRGGSSAMTGGILGSGAGLAKWEAEQAAKANQEYIRSISQNQGKLMGGNMVNDVLVPGMANGSGNNPNIGESVFLETMKKRWYYVVGAVGVIGGTAYFFGNRKPGNKRKVK